MTVYSFSFLLDQAECHADNGIDQVNRHVVRDRREIEETEHEYYSKLERCDLHCFCLSVLCACLVSYVLSIARHVDLSRGIFMTLY